MDVELNISGDRRCAESLADTCLRPLCGEQPETIVFLLIRLGQNELRSRIPRLSGSMFLYHRHLAALFVYGTTGVGKLHYQLVLSAQISLLGEHRIVLVILKGELQDIEKEPGSRSRKPIDHVVLHQPVERDPLRLGHVGLSMSG